MAATHDPVAHLTAFVERQMQAQRTPSLVLAVTDRERTLGVWTVGFADLAARRPVTPATLFPIASIGKSFTAVALLQAHEAGRLDLQAPVVRYLPWFSVPSRFPPITIHSLVSHTAGIPCGVEGTPDGRSEVWNLRHTEAASAPGAHFHYSDVGYKVLGLVLEAVVGAPYGAIVQRQILDPLGMAATAPVMTHALRPRLAVGYTPLYDDRPPNRSQPLVPATWVETDTADGCLASTAADMAAYLRLLLNRGQGPGGRLLTEASWRLLTGRTIEIEDGWFYGYGLRVFADEGHTHVGHGGDMPGYAASLRADLDAGLGAVALMSEPLAPGIAAVALRLFRQARDGRELLPLPPPADPTQVAAAADYAGAYTGRDRTLTLEAIGGRLVLHWAGTRIALEPRGEDCFVVPHPDFELFLLRFGRAASPGSGGVVTEAVHGPDWYGRGPVAGPVAALPDAWAAYPGHYRAHTPWSSNFRVVPRQGGLWLIEAAGDEAPLVPLADGRFRVGEAAQSPERIGFDAIVDGRALRATRSGTAYYRFFTP